MSYSAVALVRTASGWSGSELDLADVGDLDEAADLLRDLVEGADGAAAPGLLFLEEDDEYVAVVRVDGDDDPRVFLSDYRAVDGSDLAGRLFEDVVPLSAGDDPDGETTAPEGEPAGDPAVLADLGTSPEELLDLVNEEGVLPGDVIYAVCERAGCVDVLEHVRGT